MNWLSWLLGTSVLAAVVAAALHFSEGEEFIRLLQQAQPWWVVLAFILQAATYLAEGQIWRSICRAAGVSLSAATAFQLSLTKLFVDQAIPSAGISGAVVVAKALEQRALPRGTIAAGFVVRTVSYYAAYVASLGAALLIMAIHGQINVLLVLVSVLFVLFAVPFSVAALTLSGRGEGSLTGRLTRFPYLRAGLGLLEGADAKLARNRALLLEASAFQLGIVLLDATTVWVLIGALGATADLPGVFASFMISTLFRSIGILPGGLGSFEAVSVVTLKMAGVPIPAALSATLIFRGLSFWLPMLPGFWFSRHAIARKPEGGHGSDLAAYWSLDPAELMRRLESSDAGLTTSEADQRLQIIGPNELREQRPLTRLGVLANQLRNPLLLLLVFAAAVSILTGEWADAVIVLAIVLASVWVGYSREYSAQSAAAALRARVHTRTTALRDGKPQGVPLEGIVPGDIVILSAGSVVPADALILEASDCYVSESVLTGESFPVQKTAGVLETHTPLAKRGNCVFLGTNVRSGTARCIVVHTGLATEFGGIAHRLSLRPPDTEFDRGMMRFGYLLTSAMLVMVLLVFIAHVLQGRPPVETLLFSIALAVGLSPELLPAILSVNLARGAQMMARRGVLVRRLNAIENLGSMDVLCTDKTGTITEGVVKLEGAYDALGAASAQVLDLGAINAALETGLDNPLDDAILQAHGGKIEQLRKLAEIPFDFVRKRVSVIVEGPAGVRLVTKGAFHHVMEACASLADGTRLDDDGVARLEKLYETWSGSGIRVLAVATRDMAAQHAYGREDEHDLAFAGFLTFQDRPKDGAAEAIAGLGRLGISIKIITGDNKLVAQHMAGLVGLPAKRILTGAQLDEFHDEALWREAERTDLFVEVDPNQKERIILSLKKMGHVVGFLGDGVNDAPAMHAADTSLSVEQAVDVAREAADFVLLERHLEVIRRGVEEGRKTFANTLKYVLTTTSANLGNMVSMAVASLFLPFLPLLAGQILLNNFLSDIPAVGLADDSVDPELIDRPRRWDMRFIGRFMVEFGVLSSAFDFLTFAVLLWTFQAPPELFRTGWFVESLLTELVIALVVRTRRLFFRSRPGTLLMASTAVLVLVAFAIPFLPYARLAGFVPLPGSLLLTLITITALYVVAAERTKAWFYRDNK